MKAGGSDELCACCIFRAALTTMDEEQAKVEATAMVLGQQHFPGYELLGEIARGGMGVVFRARQLCPDRMVALKVIAAGELASPRMVERFRTEAETAARLDHPHIVPIYEVGHQRGWHFFSMRLIEGCTLGAKLQSHGLAPVDAAKLMVKIARAVQHAHERGVLHRDLKPNNILIDTCGEPHLTDFGLAKMLERSVEMTLSNMVLGTPAYMAPEQAAGGTRDVTVAVDVYGLGAVFYEMIAGRPPFEAPTPHALLRLVAEEEPSPPSYVQSGPRKSELMRAAKAASDKREGVDQILASAAATNALLSDLDAICLRCLEKEPARRYHTAEDFADDLERALRGEPIQAKPITGTQRLRKWIRRNPASSALIATAALSLVVIMLGSVLFSVRVNRARAEAQSQLVSKYLNDAARLAADDDAFRGALALSHALRQTETDDAMWPRIIERLNATFQLSPRLLRLRGVEGVPAKLEFSNRNQDLRITLRDGNALRWNLPVNQITMLPDRVPLAPRGVALSPSGEWRLARNEEGSAVTLTHVPTETNVATYSLSGQLHVMNFSPDSATFAMAAFREQARVYESASGQARGQPITHENGANQALFSPDGSLLVTAGFDYRLRIQGSANHRLAAPAIRHSCLIESVAFSLDGRFLAVGDIEGVVQLWDLNTEVRPLLLKNEPLRRAVLSPVENLAVVAGRVGALHVLDLATREEVGAPMPVPPTLGERRFDRSGRWLAVGCRQAGARIFDFATRQLRHEIRDLSDPSADMNHVVFSPDGTAVVTATPTGVAQRWSVADGHALGPRMVRDEETFLLYWSGDGRWISTGGGRSAHVWDAATGELLGIPVRLKEGEHIEECAFSPDGRRLLIVFSNRSAEPTAGRIFELPSLKPVGAPLRHGDGVRDADYSPDGRFIVTVGEDNTARLWNALDGSPAGPALRHSDIVRAIAFRRDGQVLATGSMDGTLRLWDPERGELMAPPLHFGSEVSRIGFNARGDRVLFNVEGSQTFVAPLSRNPMSVEAHEALAELQSGLRLDASLNATELSAAELENKFIGLMRRVPERLAWPDDSPQWHQQRAIVAEREDDWFAAAFHLEHLAVLDPADADVQIRLARARRHLR